MTKYIDHFQLKGLHWYFIKGAWIQGKISPLRITIQQDSHIQYYEKCFLSTSYIVPKYFISNIIKIMKLFAYFFTTDMSHYCYRFLNHKPFYFLHLKDSIGKVSHDFSYLLASWFSVTFSQIDLFILQHWLPAIQTNPCGK